jgi:periplasmic protein TonB
MNSQIKAFQWSCLIHGLFIGAVIGLGLFFKNPPKMLVINFDLEPAPAQLTESQSAQQPAHSKKQQSLRKEASLKAPPIQKERPMPKPLETPIKEPLPELQPQVTPFPSEQAVPIFSPPAKTQTEAEKPTGPSGASTGTGMGNVLSSGHSDGSGSGNLKGSGSGSGRGEDKGQTRYVREHFTYIRDKILRNIRYPAIARRLGWQGRVLISFVINLDGSIKEAKVMQGSGFEVLDKNAIETVKDTAPFPKPPIEAQLVIPIIFRLDS